MIFFKLKIYKTPLCRAISSRYYHFETFRHKPCKNSDFSIFLYFTKMHLKYMALPDMYDFKGQNIFFILQKKTNNWKM